MQINFLQKKSGLIIVLLRVSLIIFAIQARPNRSLCSSFNTRFRSRSVLLQSVDLFYSRERG